MLRRKGVRQSVAGADWRGAWAGGFGRSPMGSPSAGEGRWEVFLGGPLLG